MALSSSNFGNLLKYGGLTSAAGGLAGLLFGGNDPTKQAQSTIGKIPGQVSPYYQPYMSAGTNALSSLQDQYTQLLSNPGAMFNQMGESFQQSPGFNFAMQQALQGANHAAAAGGMAGSPQAMQQNETLATNLADQDYYNYMNQVMGLYGEGLHGEEGMAKMGLGATQDMTQAISRTLAAQSLLQAQAAKGKAQSQGDFLGDILGGTAAALAFW